MSDFKFYLVTDTHYFAQKLGCRGEAYREFMQFEQKCYAETQAINEAAFDWLCRAQDAQNVLIAGDLTFNGEKQSHIEFTELLKKLKASGKNVYVITAAHDCNDHPFCFDETGRHVPEGTKREELFDMYFEYGFQDAIAVDREGLSYVAQVAPGIRLLAVNCDGNAEVGHTYTKSQLAWIKEQTDKAKQDNQLMFVMNHWPLLPGSPIFALLGDDVVMKDWDKITDMYADAGVHLAFTGHMHNQSINRKLSPAGNEFYDVCTGSLIGCPAFLRLVNISDSGEVTIDSIPTPDFEWDFEGLTQTQYFARQFNMMIESCLSAMEYNPKRFMGKVGIKYSPALAKIIVTLGKKVNRATVGSLARLCCVKCPDCLKDKSLKQFLLSIVMNAFCGDEPYVPGTPEHELIMSILKRLNPVLNILNQKIKVNGKPVNLAKLIEDSIGNTGMSDYRATFNIKK